MIKALIKTVALLVAIAYYTLAERKIMGSAQRRYGPNVVGFWGLLQPLADGLKLIAKELVIPSHANNRIFVLAPLAVFMLTLLAWSIIPLGCVELCYAEYDIVPTPFGVADLRYGLLAILAISSFSVYWIALAGWASNSKYAFLGSLRSAAQMISYEVAISLTLLPVVVMAGSMNLSEIVLAQVTTLWFGLPLLPMALVFAISMIAETNRTPFDLPEAEAELVAGYNVEYSSITFAMFFLAEYGNMILAAVIYAIFFLGGGLIVLKALLFCFLFVLVRATLPRYRYDQLMDIGWKVFLPTATAYFLLVLNLLYTVKAAPSCCTWLV